MNINSDKNKFKKDYLGWCRYHLLTFVVWFAKRGFSLSEQYWVTGFLTNETNFQMHFIEDSWFEKSVGLFFNSLDFRSW